MVVVFVFVVEGEKLRLGEVDPWDQWLMAERVASDLMLAE